MTILVTGSEGFIGKNLVKHLRLSHDVIEFTSDTTWKVLKAQLPKIDFIFHLAGVNRDNEAAITSGNLGLTKKLCTLLSELDLKTPILLSSSTQALEKNVYGKSKLNAENELIRFSKKNNSKIIIYRLPNVFGKWCKPNYNSVVATFCHNINNNLPISINNPNHSLNLVYIDDVVSSFCNTLEKKLADGIQYKLVRPVYKITLKKLAERLEFYKNSKVGLPATGKGLDRALYATFLSYKKTEDFTYKLKENIDNRGKFVELFQTTNSGQFSYFTSKPGVTRGLHYHHTKNEKFIVVKGKARFNYRNLESNKKYSISVNESKTTVVETIPGWVHSVTNTGSQDLIVVLWANENFDIKKPDTYSDKI
jgi:UDP-2-acetamido-2,6-beta-L-arabino-hexul-4-ose reductase